MDGTSLNPSLTTAAAREEQNAMCTIVKLIGYGNPEYDSTYLLMRMTAALRVIHSIK
jgi:hypothetical protein